MSHFHRPGTKLQERQESEDQSRAPFADVASRFANWFAGMDRVSEPEPGGDETPEGDPLQALNPGAVDDRELPSRFPVAPLGYNRAAVDEHLSDLEQELSELGRELAVLRAQRETPMSVTEELERLGEQTASILVVAHDKANETTRRAQAEAERCLADAAANALAVTEGAKHRLRELDNETDSVWRERERLLEDVRAVSAALSSLADQASERFPAAGDQVAQAVPARAPWEGATVGFEPQKTRSFTAAEAAQARGEAPPAQSPEPMGEPGDTASWLAGFETLPPEDDSAHQ